MISAINGAIFDFLNQEKRRTIRHQSSIETQVVLADIAPAWIYLNEHIARNFLEILRLAFRRKKYLGPHAHTHRHLANITQRQLRRAFNVAV